MNNRRYKYLNRRYYDPALDDDGNVLPIVPQNQTGGGYNNPAALGDPNYGSVNYNPFALGSNPFSNQGGNIGSQSPNAPMPSSPASKGGIQSFGFGNLVGAGIGAAQSIYAMSQLNKLEKEPEPEYTIAPELQTAYNTALGMSQQGLTPSEKQGAENDISRGAATSFYQTSKMAGGNLSNAIIGGIDSNQLGAYDKLAAVDAETHRANLKQYYGLANAMQKQENVISKSNIEARYNLEQAWGDLGKQGISNLGKSLNFGAIGGSLFTNPTAIASVAGI
jgi:hypothetical protein